jgi:hypothetical protein
VWGVDLPFWVYRVVSLFVAAPAQQLGFFVIRDEVTENYTSLMVGYRFSSTSPGNGRLYMIHIDIQS